MAYFQHGNCVQRDLSSVDNVLKERERADIAEEERDLNAAEGETVYAGQDEEDDTDAREGEPAILNASHE